MLSFVGADSFLELLLADVTPRTDGVADYFYVELGHPAQRGPEHANAIWDRHQDVSTGIYLVLRSWGVMTRKYV